MWHHLYIDHPDDAHIATGTIQKSASAVMLATGNKNVAVFSRIDDEKPGMHFYFSPAASSVARGCGAATCGKPAKEEVGSLLFGDQTVIPRLFG